MSIDLRVEDLLLAEATDSSHDSRKLMAARKAEGRLGSGVVRRLKVLLGWLEAFEFLLELEFLELILMVLKVLLVEAIVLVLDSIVLLSSKSISATSEGRLEATGDVSEGRFEATGDVKLVLVLVMLPRGLHLGALVRSPTRPLPSHDRLPLRIVSEGIVWEYILREGWLDALEDTLPRLLLPKEQLLLKELLELTDPRLQSSSSKLPSNRFRCFWTEERVPPSSSLQVDLSSLSETSPQPFFLCCSRRSFQAGTLSWDDRAILFI